MEQGKSGNSGTQAGSGQNGQLGSGTEYRDSNSQDRQAKGKGRDLAPGQAVQGTSGREATHGNDSPSVVIPPVDIFEDEQGITVLADMPGMSKEHLAVRVAGDNLVIEGAAKAPINDEMEILYGEVQNLYYRRSFTLSRELDPSKIEARLDQGVLTLIIPKAEEARPRRIEIKVAETG